MRHLCVAFLGLTLSAGCGKAEETKDKATDKAKGVADKAKGAADKVTDEGKALADKAKGLGGDVVEMLTPGALAVEGSIEGIVLRGKQVGGVAAEIGSTLSAAVDSDTVIKPIYQKLDDEEAKAETDKAIGDMPRTEVIDGLTIGFKQLSSISTKERVTESGYLVVWRRDDHLVGFVYRSKKVIDLEMLVKETPRLVKLVGTVL